MMMIMISAVHEELMLMLNRQADLVVHLEANEVTKEVEKVD